ncbi:hypothetical protein [Kribbella sp. NPDC000426]|uniref:hypothetical protein n=1 Tax=Kribbella sp. NPDC000426 TaxID=3154255 RepID=UPI00332BA1D3
MNLQDLRDELATRAATADDHPADLLPGVRTKIRGTRRRRTYTALGVVAVIAAIGAGLVPSLRSTRPDPADDTPRDYTRNGLTVPGTVGSDKLLKAWIGDRGQDELSFAWTPQTTSVTLRADCSADGGMFGVRFTINGWYVGDAGCDSGPDTWTMGSSAEIRADDALWLTSPVGKPVQVTAQVIDVQTRKPGAKNAQLAVGIYATGPKSTDGPPTRAVPADPNAYSKDGVVYRSTIGGDTLAGAKVADPGRTEVRFSFTATGNRLVLHDFCTANAGYDSTDRPYSVSIRVGPGAPYSSTCDASSTDAGTGSSMTIASPVPAGERVDVVAQIVPSHRNGPAAPPDARLGLGVYFEGNQHVVDGVFLPERIESGGYDYKLADVRTAPGPSKTLSMVTPANTPYVIAYGSSPLGVSEHVEGTLRVGKSESGIGVAAGSGGSLGIARDPRPAGPAETAGVTVAVTGGVPTKGKLILAIYLPV